MQVRAFRLPPLPNRKNQPIQIDNRPSPVVPQSHHRIGSFSRQKRQRVPEQKQNSISRVLERPSSVRQRPSSVRSYSRESINSRQSRNSRDSSREGSLQLAKNKINHNTKLRLSMPSVSAKSWAVYEMKQAKFIYGKRIFKKREIASLTKMMNFITILSLVKEHNLQAVRVRVRASRQASYINGTTAQLKQGIELSLYDLYFGMMLPSGNDAAFQIAQIGGCLILMQKMSEENIKDILYDVDKITEFYEKHPQAVKLYLAQMNKVSKKYGMQNSHFANPHGLSNPDNYSCAQDLCKLCTNCMENQMFRYVVATQNYYGKYRLLKRKQKDICLEIREDELEQGDMQQKMEEGPVVEEGSLKWENTNKMLKQNWSGIKTGITPNAGPCLAASVTKFHNGRSLQFLVILICSKSMEARWTEAKQIVEWVIDEQIYF